MGGGGGDQQAAAERAERERRAQVTATQQRIEGIYTSPGREADINDLIGATRSYLQQDLDRQNAASERGARFALARSGLTMGSADVDTNRKLAESSLRGALEVERRSQAAGNTLRQRDQESKLNLFNMAQSGLDMTTAARQAGEALRSNIGLARADALQTGLGNVFGDMGELYKRSRERAGERQAQRDFNFYSAPYAGGGGW
jgi:hypothetical protein